MSGRSSGLVGLGSFVLIVVASLVSPPLWNAPPTTASAPELAAYLQDDRGRILASLFLFSLAMGLFLCFTAGLWSHLHASGSRALGAAFAFGAVALATLILAGFVPVGVAAYRVHEPELAQALNDLTFGLLALSGIPTTACLGAYAALVWRDRRLPAWTAGIAALGAVAHVVIAASLLSRSGFVSLEGDVIVWVPGTFFGWILAVSVALLRARPEPEAAI